MPPYQSLIVLMYRKRAVMCANMRRERSEMFESWEELVAHKKSVAASLAATEIASSTATTTTTTEDHECASIQSTSEKSSAVFPNKIQISASSIKIEGRWTSDIRILISSNGQCACVTSCQLFAIIHMDAQ